MAVSEHSKPGTYLQIVQPGCQAYTLRKIHWCPWLKGTGMELGHNRTAETLMLSVLGM